MMALAARLLARGHRVNAFLREPETVVAPSGEGDVRIFPSPRWIGPIQKREGLNYAEILLNFGFHSSASLNQLVDAWRHRIAGADLLVSNVAPAALLAARTLAVPALEISQGYHVPPPGLPSPPFRDWEPAPRARLIASDRIVLQAINSVLKQHGHSPIDSLGDLFVGRTLLQTYPELEMYPDRGHSDYFGVVPAKGRPMLEWPTGRPRVLAYLYPYYEHLGALLDVIDHRVGAAIIVCLGISDTLRRGHESESIVFADRLLDFPQMAAQADIVICHGSHQATAEALLAGKPLLMLPTQVEQFLTTRRVVRQGAGLGILPGVASPDFSTALHALLQETSFGAQAQAFAKRYSTHQRDAALDTLAARCEAARSRPPKQLRRPRLHVLAPFNKALTSASCHALALSKLLRSEADITLWSLGAPAMQNDSNQVHQVDASRAAFPSGGTLILIGVRAPIGEWLRRAWFDRCVLVYDQWVSPATVKLDIESLHSISLRVDVAYPSTHLAAAIGTPGSVLPLPIDTKLYSPAQKSLHPFTVGCSVDASSGSYPRDDTVLFTRLKKFKMRVRVVTEDPPSEKDQAAAGVEFVASGIESSADFLHSLDVYVIRSSHTARSDDYACLAAMSCSLPVVCNKTSTAADRVVHGETGFLYATDEEAESLILLLRDDIELRSRVGRAAREAVTAALSDTVRRRIADYFLGGTAADNA